MPINKSEKIFFDLLQRTKPKMDHLPNLYELRSSTGDLFDKYSGPLPKKNFIERLIKAREGERIRIRVFNPQISGKSLFFLPGNAFLFDLFESNSVAASRIAAFGNCKVIIIDYRLMPENSWPVSLNDVEDVMTHMCQPSNPYGIDPGHVYLAGVCSGANVAARFALNTKRTLKIQKLLLLNGLYDQSLSQSSHSKWEKEDQMVVRSKSLWWLDYYKISLEEGKSKIYSPLYAEDFSALPEVLIMVSEYDGFRSDSEAFYLKLKEEAVPVEKMVIPAQTHNTMLLRAVMTDGPDPAELLAKAIINSGH